MQYTNALALLAVAALAVLAAVRTPSWVGTILRPAGYVGSARRAGKPS